MSNADKQEDEVGLINPEEKPVENEPSIDDKHCFPYVDFAISLGRRFNGSFLFILIV